MGIIGSTYRLAKNIGKVDANAKKYQSPAEDYDFKNKDFEELAERNPALQYQYTPGWWDKIGNFFGFRTAEDKFRDEQYNKAADIDAQYMQLDREEDYNSAEEQAMRERMAGMNPNLTGNVDAGEASEFDNQAVQGQESPMTNQDQFMKTMNVGISALGTASNILITGLTLANDTMGLISNKQNAISGIYQFAKDYLEGHGAGYDDYVNLDFFDEHGLNADKFMNNPEIRNLYPSRWERKIAFQAFRDALKDIRVSTSRTTNEGKSIDAYLDKMKAGLRSDAFWGDNAYTNQWNLKSEAAGAYKLFQEFDYKVAKAMKEYENNYYKTASGGRKALAENAQNKYTWEYYNNLKGADIAGAANAQANAAKANAEITAKINGAFSDLITGVALKASDPEINVVERAIYTGLLKVAGDIFNQQTKLPFVPPGLQGGMSSGAANALMQGAMGL